MPPSRLAEPTCRLPRRRSGSCLASFVALLLCVMMTGRGAEAAEQPLRLAVASSFRAAAEALAADYAATAGEAFLFSGAASGVLAAQLRQGAPFDLFFAADADRPQRLFAEGIGASAPRCYAQGALVLLGADDLATALADPHLSIAIANPRAAPYGVAALEVLGRDGFAGPGARRVVRGANVQQAMQYYDSGGAELALVARSVAQGRGIDVPPAWHSPIRQYALVVAGGERAARAQRFLDFVLAPAQRERLRAFGFDACT